MMHEVMVQGLRTSNTCLTQAECHLLMATFWVMSRAFVLAVGHGEVAYFTIPVLFSLISLHTLYYMYLLKFLLHILSIIKV